MTGPHIYDDPNERWLVELRVSYPDAATLRVDGATDARSAARSALALVTDEFAGHGTNWVVTDRATGAVTVLEQREFSPEQMCDECSTVFDADDPNARITEDSTLCSDCTGPFDDDGNLIHPKEPT